MLFDIFFFEKMQKKKKIGMDNFFFGNSFSYISFF